MYPRKPQCEQLLGWLFSGHIQSVYVISRCKVFCIVIRFFPPLVCLYFPLVHFKNGPEYLTKTNSLGFVYIFPFIFIFLLLVCLYFPLVHFKNGPEYLTRRIARVLFIFFPCLYLFSPCLYLFSPCLYFPLVHFKNGPEYLTRRIAWFWGAFLFVWVTLK